MNAVEIIKQLDKLPVISISGSGNYRRVNMLGVTGGCLRWEAREAEKEWNVGWFAVDYKDLLKLINRLEKEGES